LVGTAHGQATAGSIFGQVPNAVGATTTPPIRSAALAGLRWAFPPRSAAPDVTPRFEDAASDGRRIAEPSTKRSEPVKKTTSCGFLLSRARYTPGLAHANQSLA
jgi:hypothetical protein